MGLFPNPPIIWRLACQWAPGKHYYSSAVILLILTMAAGPYTTRTGFGAAIQDGVYLSYLLSLGDDASSDLLRDRPDATAVSDLPPGRWEDRIGQFFRDHRFTPYNASTPPAITVLNTRPGPPSAVELLLATSVLYHAAHRSCVAAARPVGFGLNPAF